MQDGQLYQVIYTNSKKGDALSLYIKDAKTRIFNGSHIGPDTKAAWEDYFWPWLSKDMKSWLSKFYPLNLLSASPLFSVLKMYISVLPCQRTEADRNRPHSASALQQPQMLIVVTDSCTK